MPEIRPFRGLRYNPDKVDIASVIAPPYDVISPGYQNELYARNPYNVVRLILGREKDRYAEAAGNLTRWKDEGILEVDARPSLYVLEQVFKGQRGEEQRRLGFIAACRVAEFGEGSVLPHEKTHSKPKEDRLRLLQTTKTNLSQIFSIYSDPEEEIDGLLRERTASASLFETEFEGVLNRFWILDDKRVTEKIVGLMKNKTALIADGHHRYETALAYRDMMRLKSAHPSGGTPDNFTMMFFSNLDASGLVVFPTHRVIHGLEKFDENKFFGNISGSFDVVAKDSIEEIEQELSGQKEYAYGVVCPGRSALIRLKEKKSLAELVGEDTPPEVRELDVTLLHTYIFGQVLGMSREVQDTKKNLEYVKEAGEAAELVRSGKAQAAFIMNPTQIEQVRRVSRSGYTMPQKSTFFYPKILSGLVMNRLDDQREDPR